MATTRAVEIPCDDNNRINDTRPIPPYHCKQCGKQFKYQSRFKQHEKKCKILMIVIVISKHGHW